MNSPPNGGGPDAEAPRPTTTTTAKAVDEAERTPLNGRPTVDPREARFAKYGLIPHPPHPGYKYDPQQVRDWLAEPYIDNDYWDKRLIKFGFKDPPPARAAVNGRNVNGSTRPSGNREAWAHKVFQGEAGKVATAVEGTRNDTLNTAALRLYRIVLTGLLDGDTVTDALTEAARRAGLPDTEIRGTLGSAWSGAQAYGPADDVPEEREPDVVEVAPGTLGGTIDSDKPEQPVYACRVLTRSALRDLPDPEPLIDNVLDRGTVPLLYGKHGTAKSFITLDWGASVATGRSWQGRAVHQCRVLYVAGEGAFGLKGRIEAWEVGWRTKIPDGDFAILPFAVNLTRPMEVANLRALIAWGGYNFVELDTLARCMVGADENSAKDCGIVIDSMARLLASTPGGRGCVLGVHHAGKDGKTLRGSSAFEGAADTVYFTSKDGGLITLDREKRKDGPEGDHHDLKIDLVPDTSSAVISAQNLSTWGVDKPERAQRLLSTFVHHFSTTGASKAEMRAVADMPDTTFFRAVSDLVKSGDLYNTGTVKRPFYMLSSK